ncbi:proliferation marker protein Ki-67 isoform X2 [Conger conger]|uniref:proliferation marker protein Ki-67 isoform X2 n=1 Tax=Conger conger TaxID=82655 RepID=UPI002A598BA9|nr:proliferation marker protein Ki-67 isoform X2 [Conger conger]
MPLHGKIVVIKRSGGDGTEFPITASCLFGRKPDCDIRIQLPQVSKEHCRIDLNENKEVMLTNLSSVNPTRINGEALKQAQHLKHGDVITVIDRSFRFEYPPVPTPKKKRSSLAGKSETLQVLHDQQVADSGTGERRKSSDLISDGTNTNVQALAVEDCNETAKEVDQTGLDKIEPNEEKSRSPFCELYQIVKHNLTLKSPWKPAETAQPKTPLSWCEPQKIMEVKTMAEEIGGEEATSQDDQSTPLPTKVIKQKRRSSVGCVVQTDGSFSGEATPKSSKRRSRVSSGSSLEASIISALPEGQAEDSSQLVATPSKATPSKATPSKATPSKATPSKATPSKASRRSLETPAKQSIPEEKGTPRSQKKPPQGTPQKFSANEVARQIVSENSVTEETLEGTEKSETPKGRRSTASTVLPVNSAVTPGTPGMSHVADGHDEPTLKQLERESEADLSEAVQEKSPKAKESVSPRRVSPRKSPGKKLQASDVPLELELTAPPSGGKSVKAGTPTSSKKRKSEKLESDLPGPQLKRKRVSFGGQLSPELFDKRLPPDSPLRRGATPGRRSLSILRQSLLRGSSTVGLIEELCAKSKTPKRSPGKKASPKPVSPKNGSSSPANKPPKTKAKTPSPKKTVVGSSPGQKSVPKTTSPGKRSPSTEDPKVPKGRKSVSPSAKTPQTPSSGKTPAKKLNESLQKSPLTSKKTPSQPLFADAGSPSVTSARKSDALKMSPGQSTAKMPKTPLPAEKASGPTAKTPSPKGGMSFKEGSFNQTPAVKGRFSISRVSTPSPVVGQDAGAMETSACVTPKVPLRRESMKSTSKKTPKSARKSVLEVIRSRRSGASRANLKVLSSWANIVKFGVSKPQTATTTKQCTRKVTSVKKTVVKKPKTPATKVKGHFSTGHAASPATIVVGKAHTRVAQSAGFAPKIVHNIALLRKNMKVNEDLTGIAEIFRTPANLQKTKRTSDIVCPKTPQAASVSVTESSVMDTPEEMGEMVVSPLSVISTEKHRMYDSEAIAWLLQEDQDSSLNGDDAPQERDAEGLITPLVTDEPEQEPVPQRGLRTPKQKSEPVTCLTGVKRLVKTPKQVEDLGGIEGLLKIPREPKVSQEASLVGMKEMKTPKQKIHQVEDLRGIKRLLKTPREPKVSQEACLVGVKEIMKTPKLKTTPLVCTTGVKRLMTTPKQKGEPVEDMIGLKRLMQTPKQKVEPVEDLTGVKELMKTPKQKGQPVESKFGIRKLMKSPKQRGVPVEDFAGLQELMEEPLDYLPFTVCETSEEKVSGTCVSPELEKSIPVFGEAEMASKEKCTELIKEESQSNATKKSAKETPQKQVEKISGVDAQNSDHANTEAVAEMISAGVVDQNLPEVKPKRGRQARQVAAPAVKRTRQISKIKEEPINSAVAVPTKCTRRKVAKNVDESEKGTIEEKLCEKVESIKEAGDEERSSDMESPALNVAPANGRRGKKSKEILQNDTSTAPVRKTGRGRKANLTDGIDESNKVKCREMSPAPKKDEEDSEKMPVPVPVMEPKRGRRPKKADSGGHVTEAQTTERIVSDAEQSVGNCLPESKEETPVVKSGRGRRAKAVVQEVEASVEVLPKRSRRGAVDSSALQTFASPVPSLKSVRGRGRKVQNLESTEETVPVQAPISAAECSTQSPKKVRGKRGAKSSATVALDASSAPLDAVMPDASFSNDLVTKGQAIVKRKGISRKAGVHEADKNVPTQVISEESTAGFAEYKNDGVEETSVNLGKQTNPRRGRAGKKSTVEQTASAPVTEHLGPKTFTGKAPSTRKGRAQAVEPKPVPVEDDVPIVKAGTKRKLTREVTDKVTGDNNSTGESVSLDPLPKRARGRAAKVEETKLDTSKTTKRGAAKKSGKTLDNDVKAAEPIVETPKPARRGRRNVAQQDAVAPVPAQEECPAQRKMESAKRPATRRLKSEKKTDCARSEEAKPVRRTRQK